MVRLVMHIGSHKAGSTSIQEFCHRNPEALAAAGVHYPSGAFARYPEQHSELEALIEHDRMAEARQFFTAAATAAAARGASTVFISGEDLCALGPGLAHRLWVAATETFESLRVVLILRNKRDYLYSSFKHHLLNAPMTAEHDFVARQAFSPRRAAEAWRGLNGVALDVLSFDAMRGDLLGAFFRTVFGMAVSSPLMENRSLDYMTLQMLNIFGKRPDEAGVAPELVRRVLEVLERHPPPAPLPIEDLIADNLDRCYPDADWRVPGIDFTEALLARRRVAAGGCDRAADAARMSELYLALHGWLAEDGGSAQLAAEGG